MFRILNNGDLCPWGGRFLLLLDYFFGGYFSGNPSLFFTNYLILLAVPTGLESVTFGLGSPEAGYPAAGDSLTASTF